MPQAGDRVRIHYTGRFEDGTTFDSSEGREPLEFVAGAEQVIPGLERAVLQMDEGEAKTVTVPPEEAYGERRSDLAQEVDRSQLPPEVQEGSALQAQVGDETRILWVTDLSEERAVVDANHPLAGRTLVFDLQLVSVDSA